MEHLQDMARRAKKAARQLALYDTGTKRRALHAMAQALESNIPAILQANSRDVELARENGVREAMIDRLTLTRERILAGCAQGARDVAALPDPVGQVMESHPAPQRPAHRKSRGLPLGSSASSMRPGPT